jgi:hypothetical protein
MLASTLLTLTGCSTVAPMPKVNLQEPGWTARQGQAVWHLEHDSREIAGDLVVATGPEHQSFVQFSKTPFPLVIGQSDSHRWRVEFPPQNKHYSGRGQPPKRIIWLYLPRVMGGSPPPPDWSWQESRGNWRLENHVTGEAVEGYFNP